jgi:hypothetical protein
VIGGCRSRNAAKEDCELNRAITFLGWTALLVPPSQLVGRLPEMAIVQPQARPGARPPIPGGKVSQQSAVTVDGSEAMFATMCALLAAGFESNVSADHWTAFRSQMRERLQQQQGPAVDAVREFYRKHEMHDSGATLSRYVWFGLVSGPAPTFKSNMRREELPPEVIALEGFNEILSSYYQEQKIGEIWKQVQPIYNREIARLHDSVGQMVFVSSGYLREIVEPYGPRTFTVVVEPLVGRITNVRNFGEHYALVLSGGEQIPTDVMRHAFLHFLMDSLPLMYPHVIAGKRPLFERATTAPRLPADLKDDFDSFFAECVVRAVELKLKKGSPSEKEAALNRDDEDGYLLVRPLFGALPKFEQSEPSIKLFFPDLVRAFDTGTESKRVAALKFAPADQNVVPDEQAVEELARKRPLFPTTVPNDADVIAWLTEGEKRIAEKNPRAAENSFQKVLTKYPDQTRAWYGLGYVAMLDQDAARAKQVFGRLTKGEYAATQDPMVLAWSHVYLGKIYDEEGNPSVAKAEFESALAVEGLPESAKLAAQKGLASIGADKSPVRP